MPSPALKSQPSEMLPEWKIAKLEGAQYRKVGNHSAVKICHWCKNAITGGEPCYKEIFYAAHASKCLEMSPAITCNQRCLHCWRDTSIFSTGWVGPIDKPSEIIKGCIEERKKLLSGFKGNGKVSEETFNDAIKPDHAAISLTGEPCMYPRLDEMIEAYFKDFNFRTVYLVTSGTVPEMLKKVEARVLPTNLYISLEATNPEQYKKLCLPVIPNAWEKVQESLGIMRNMKTRTILRITCIKGLNMEKPEGFAEQIERAKPDFVEVKSYMFIGKSRLRLKKENMPEMKDILEFAKAIEENSSYKINDSVEESTLVLTVKKKLLRNDISHS